MAEFVFLREKGLRENNEDFYGNYKGEFFVLADGLGGHPSGEVASKKAVKMALAVYNSIQENLGRKPEDELNADMSSSFRRKPRSSERGGRHKTAKGKINDKLLVEIFERSNEAIIKDAEKSPEKFGMGTTMLTATLYNNSIVFANVGDCRAYLLSEGLLEQVTSDDRDQVGFLLRALGAHNEEVKPRIIKKKARKGDLILLCSDGLHDFVRDSLIEKILKSAASLKNKAMGLVEAAGQFGSTDNITVGLIAV